MNIVFIFKFSFASVCENFKKKCGALGINATYFLSFAGKTGAQEKCVAYFTEKKTNF